MPLLMLGVTQHVFSKITCQEIALQSNMLSFTLCLYQTPFHSRCLQCIYFGHTRRNLHLTHFLTKKLVTSVPHPLRVHPKLPIVLGTLFHYQKSKRSTFLQPPWKNLHNIQFNRRTLNSNFKQATLQFFTKHQTQVLASAAVCFLIWKQLINSHI